MMTNAAYASEPAVGLKTSALVMRQLGIETPVETPEPAASDKVAIIRSNDLRPDFDREQFSGASATVDFGVWQDRPVAIKRMHVGGWSDPTGCNMDFYKNEITILSALDHPNIVKLFGRVVSPPMLVMEALETDLLEALNAKRKIDLLQIFIQLAGVLDYLHREKRIVHCDIKVDNILLDQDGNIRLCDFGQSGFADENGVYASKRLMGTRGYLAPELPKKPTAETVSYSFRTDIYSLGVLMFTALQFYPDPELKNIVKTCLRKAPETRPTALQLKEALSAIAGCRLPLQSQAAEEKTSLASGLSGLLASP